MKKSFNVYDFIPYDSGMKPYEDKTEYFTKIPIDLIRRNLRKEFNVDLVFYVVYYNLSFNETIDHRSWIVVSDVLYACGYKLDQHKTKKYYEILKSLAFLESSGMIEFDEDEKFDLTNVTMSQVIHVRLTSIFCSGNLYVQLFKKDYEKIIKNGNGFAVENVLSIFLYASSYMINRRKDMPREEFENSPSAFFGSIESMCCVLGFSPATVLNVLHFLSDDEAFDDGEAPFIKCEVGSITDERDDLPKNLPNVYVRNAPGSDDEIQIAFNYLKKLYKKNKFDPQRGSYKKNKKNKNKTENI